MRTVTMALRFFALLMCVCWIGLVPAVAQTWGSPVWSDEFSGPLGTPIDSTKWNYDTGILNVNNEVEYYCAPSTVTGGCQTTNPNAYIDGSGHLVIQAVRLNTNTLPYSGSWTSARLLTSGTEQFQYGRVEASMMLPIGAGLWPAFWALGSSSTGLTWPATGEMDFMENVPASAGQGPTIISSTLHGPGYSGANGLSKQYHFPSGQDVTGFHTYGAIWSPNMVQFYVDDPTKVFFVRTATDIPAGTTWAFNHPFFLLLNLAVGGDGSWPGAFDATTPNPAIMTVDYVKIYQAAAVPAPTFGNPASITVKAGATTSNSTTLNIGEASGSGRLFLSCSTNAAKATCQIQSNDPLNGNTVDFSTTATATATLTVFTTTNSILIPQSYRRDPYGIVKTAAIVAAVMILLVIMARLYRSLHRPGFAVGTLVILLAGIFVGCSGGTSTTQPPPGNGTPPGNYTITVNAYTLTGNGTKPDATVSVPLTVN